jgi:hypothetical protein
MIASRVLVVTALAAVFAAGLSARQTPQTFRERALEASVRDDMPAALAALDQGLKAAPRDPGLLAAKGQVYWRLLRTRSAERALLEAAKSPAYAAEAQYWLGRIYFFKGYQAEDAFPGWHEEVNYRPRAKAAFTAARDAKPDWSLPWVGLGDVAKAERREADAKAAYDKAAALGRPAEPERTRLQELDARLAAFQKNPAAPVPEIRAAIDARIALRPDLQPFVLGANLLLARRAELAYVIELARRGRLAGEQFIRENESSYKMDGKVQGSLDRNQATFADIAGWAAYLQNDLPVAEQRLAEAARLFRNNNVSNETHLAELSRTKGELETAREHYLRVMELASSQPPQRDAAKAALGDIQAKLGENPAEFETWLTATLERRRDERRRALVTDMTGKSMPAVTLTDLQGNQVDLRAQRGNVVLLNFFNAW